MPLRAGAPQAALFAQRSAPPAPAFASKLPGGFEASNPMQMRLQGMPAASWRAGGGGSGGGGDVKGKVAVFAEEEY
jgi:hypothetical protein